MPDFPCSVLLKRVGSEPMYDALARWMLENEIDPDAVANFLLTLRDDRSFPLQVPSEAFFRKLKSYMTAMDVSVRLTSTGIARTLGSLEPFVAPIRTALPQATEIWFHGSRATGTEKPGSDIDILVLYEGLKDKFDAIQALSGLYRGAGERKIDIQPAPAEDKARSGSVAWWAVREGWCLWSAEAMPRAVPAMRM